MKGKKVDPVYYKDKAIVLMYHDIVENDKKASIANDRFKKYIISIDYFSGHLDTLMKNGYNLISMENFIEFMSGGKEIPPNAIVITFDDGFESFYKLAYPELKKRNIPATNFIPVKLTDDPLSMKPLPYDRINDIPHLTWNQIHIMIQHGMSFYSHTYNQHRLEGKNAYLTTPIFLKSKNRMETNNEYLKRIRRDLEKAERILEDKLKNEVKLLCFPYGKYNDSVLSIGQELGIKLFFTVKEGINEVGQRTIYRINGGSSEMSAEKLINKLKQYL